MYLKQLSNIGLAAIAEWRTMWNQSVLPYLRSQKIVAGKGVRANQHPTGTVIEVVTAGGCAAQPVSLRLGAVVTMPTGGTGAGAISIATPTASGGIIVSSGASIPVVMPYLDGAN